MAIDGTTPDLPRAPLDASPAAPPSPDVAAEGAHAAAEIPHAPGAEEAAPTLAEAAIAAVVAADPNLENVTLALPVDAITFLSEEASRRGTSSGEVVRIAIGLLRTLSGKVAEGGKVQVRMTQGVTDVAI